jgi:hypothetical protein
MIASIFFIGVSCVALFDLDRNWAAFKTLWAKMPFRLTEIDALDAILTDSKQVFRRKQSTGQKATAEAQSRRGSEASGM